VAVKEVASAVREGKVAVVLAAVVMVGGERVAVD
jgi:hypothetical protein